MRQRPRFWWLRFCSCHVDCIFGRFHDHYCPRHGVPEDMDVRQAWREGIL